MLVILVPDLSYVLDSISLVMIPSEELILVLLTSAMLFWLLRVKDSLFLSFGLIHFFVASS